MKLFARFTITSVLLSVAAFAAETTLNGTLVDVMCKTKDLASHTKKCALGCAKGGFGLVTADGKFVKFDEGGNTKAVAALKATSKDTDLKAKVSGDVDGDMIKVTSIEIQ
jgi:hypothetical protein